jgi:hypothetical protein
MKFVDLINEDFTPDSEQLKELKNAKAVFLAHRKGTLNYRTMGLMKTNNELNKTDVIVDRTDTVVGYKLGEAEYNWYSDSGFAKDMYLSVSVKNITVYIKDPVLYLTVTNSPDRIRDYYGNLIHNNVVPRVTKRFKEYGVKLHITPKVDFVLVEPKKTEEPEQINEDPTVGEQNRLTDKEMKNFKALWRSYKEGVFKYDDKKYMYQLKNEHDVFKMPSTEYASSRIVVLINGAFESSIRVYEIQDNGHNVLLDYGLENRLYSLVKAKVKRNFASHNVHLHL